MQKYKILVITRSIEETLPNVLKSTFGSRPTQSEKRSSNAYWLEYDDAIIMFKRVTSFKEQQWKGFRCNEVFVDKKLVNDSEYERLLYGILDQSNYVNENLPHYSHRNEKIRYMWW